MSSQRGEPAMTRRTRTVARLLAVAAAWALATAPARAGEVSGRVAMPEVCAPEVSPAVVVLEPVGKTAAAPAPGARPTDVALVNQRGLQFVPRVQAVALGQSVRFTNEDN